MIVILVSRNAFLAIKPSTVVQTKVSRLGARVIRRAASQRILSRGVDSSLHDHSQEKSDVRFRDSNDAAETVFGSAWFCDNEERKPIMRLIFRRFDQSRRASRSRINLVYVFLPRKIDKELSSTSETLACQQVFGRKCKETDTSRDRNPDRASR